MSFFVVSFAHAVEMTSTNFIIRDPIIGTGGTYGTSTSFNLISAGNILLSGVGSSTSFKTHYGFLYYPANEPQTLTFDIDTGVADGENEGPHSVALGTITTTDTRVSGTTDTIKMIIAEADTNASGGVVVTVRNANGINGLISTSVSGDNIASADATMADGTENYGLCVITAGLTGFTIAGDYNGNTCATNSETNVVEALSSTGEAILNSAGDPLEGGHAEISVNAAISGTTDAHGDYTDTLTFIATATF